MRVEDAVFALMCCKRCHILRVALCVALIGLTVLTLLGKNLAAPCINTFLMESGGRAVDCNCESTHRFALLVPVGYERSASREEAQYEGALRDSLGRFQCRTGRAAARIGICPPFFHPPNPN